MDACSSCQDLKMVIRIGNPHDLQRILGLLHGKLAAGDFAEDVTQSQDVPSFLQNPFSTLPINGPWPDVLQYYFHCTACGQLFRFEVETYHGAGGTGSPLNWPNIP